MTDKLKNREKASVVLFVVCWITYAIISMTKSAFSASIASIVEEGLFTKSHAGAINAGYYLLYGSAQILLVKFIDKVSPIKLISIALIGAAIAMFGFALASDFLTMFILWSIMGLLQFAVWPATISIIAKYLIPEHRGRAMVYIALSYCVGMFANYAVAAAVLKLSHWRTLFWV